MLKVDLHIKKTNLLLLGVVLNGMVLAQSTGIVAGSIKNANTGEPLSGVAVKIISLNKKTASEPSGNYTLAGLSQGQYTLEFSSKGWQTQTFDSVMITGGKLTKVNVDLINNNKNNTTARTAAQIDTAKTLVALQKMSAPIADGVSSLGIKGRVIDVETLEPIPGVSIVLLENGKATSTNERGEFTIPVNTKGKYSIETSYLGYNKETTPVVFTDRNWEMVNVVLVNASSALDEVVVSRRRSQVGELALLEERKNAALVVEKIGVEELSRKGVSDAATAVSKLSGVSKQEGNSQVYVRGLGDRYNTTSLNGLPIPSSNPNLKNIALDVFSTDVVHYIGVDKLHNATLNGDFGGANVDIASKNFKGDQLFEVSLGSSVNTNALKQAGNFNLQQGPSFFGFSNTNIPADAQGSYHFKNSWDLGSKNILPVDLGVKLGKSFNVGTDSRLTLFATMNFTNGYTYREGLNANVGAQGDRLKSFFQTRHSYNTKSTGMLNANYQINNKHSVAYNFLYINSGEQFADNFKGYIRDAAEDENGVVRRNTFSQTQLIINQLLGKHELTDKIDLNWGLAANIVDGDMPDRMQSQTRMLSNGDHVFIRVNEADNHRYNYFLKENEYAANIAASYKLGDDDKGKITLGYNARMKKRSFDVMQLNFNILTDARQTVIDPNNIDQYLGAAGYGTFYQLKGFAGNAFQYYNGDQNIHSAFASVDYALTDRLTAVFGARFEKIKQSVDYYSIEFPKAKNEILKDAFLPSLNLKYTLDEKQNLRFGASKTYTLPQFKERARFPYDDVTEVVLGNPYLYASDNYNLDLKWEMFPNESELISVAAFGKYIQNPINEIMIASATNDISYANTGDNGYVYGLELEFKKDILEFNGDKLSFGFNSAIMKTDQDFDAEKVNTETNGIVNIDPTHSSSKFTGASDFIINADLSYNKNFAEGKNIVATVLYNYYSDKIYAIGTGGLGHRVDKGLGTLDLIVKSKISKRIGLELAAHNILNPAFERWQENSQPVKVLSYKKGQFFNIGLKYNF